MNCTAAVRSSKPRRKKRAGKPLVGTVVVSIPRCFSDKKMIHKCPNCGRPIAERRRRSCLYCGAAIPEELLFSAAEVAQLDAATREMSGIHRHVHDRRP